MARRSIEQRLAQLDAQKRTLLARQSKLDRTKDTRRKVLLGALVLQRLEQSHDREFTKRLGDWLRRELPSFLTRDIDRSLFGDLLGSEQKPNGTGTPGAKPSEVDSDKLTHTVA